MLLARRDTREKLGVPMDGLPTRVRALLDEIQQSLLERALAFRDEHTQRVATYDEFKEIMEGRPGFVIAPVVRRGGVRSADQDRHAGDDPQHADRRRRAVRPLHPLRQRRAERSLVREVLLIGCGARHVPGTAETFKDTSALFDPRCQARAWHRRTNRG